MQTVNKVSCINNGGFQMKFQVKWSKEGATGWTDYYNNPESKTFDLWNFNIPENADVWIEVAVFLGKKKSSHLHVKYSSTVDANATYRVTGATATYKIELEGD